MGIAGQYLRTNYRVTGKHLDMDAIGGGWAHYGSEHGRWYGGFVVWSINGHAGSAAAQQSESDSCFFCCVHDIFESYFEDGRGSLNGYKIMPVRAEIRYQSLADAHAVRAHWSVSDSLIFFRFGSQASISLIAQSAYSARIIAIGFICSTPS